MNNSLVTPNYSSFQFANDFRNLCNPWLKDTKIDECFYSKAYSDGSCFNLSTFPQIDEFMLIEKKGKLNGDIKLLDIFFSNKQPHKNNRICSFTEDMDHIGFWDPLIKEFNIKSTLHITKKFDDYYEIFGFTTRFNNSFYSFYVNHFDILENFILYIRERGADLIKKGEENKIVLLNNTIKYYKSLQNLEKTLTKKNYSIPNLTSELKLKRYPISNGTIKSYATTREFECLKHIAKGYSHKETASFLQIGPRTVDTNIQKIKDRLDCTRNQLLKIYHSNYPRS